MYEVSIALGEYFVVILLWENHKVFWGGMKVL